jgi:class 3 adenylate cyclase/predicted ATPase
MRCPQCQGDNRDTAKFCEQCGCRLARACPNCGHEVSPGANFCPECGMRLTAASPSPSLAQTYRQRQAQSAPSEPMRAERGTPEAERRQLTVLFCDLVDSTALSGRLDPEELREVVQVYQAACAEVIQHYDGHIAQYLGDGLLVYFGYPRAHEDDARRAIYTGLGMVEAIGTLNAQLAQNKGIRLAVRIGIHTGLVVVGEIGGRGREERLALGETPNVAARIQGIAAPDTVVVSAATFRLVQEMFSAESLATHMLKGVATPVKVYRVVGESGILSGLDAAVTHGLTTLVGRELEVTLLLERWAQVQEGLGQVVLLSGEPGIGKSRLVGVLKEHVADQFHTRLECHCSPYHQQSALYPVTDLLQRVLAFAGEDTPDAKVQKLEAALSRVHIDLRETVPLFTALLSLPLPERYVPLALTPQRQRQRTLETLLAIILELAAQHPVLFIVEDLHWIDPSPLEFLTLLVDQVPTACIFTLFTYRQEFVASWGSRAHLTPITLNRLPRRLAENLVERVAGDKALPSVVVQQVVAKTDGVPLFVEELTKMVLESGLLREGGDRYELAAPLPPLAIPTTLHDSLMARLDRLAAVKGLAQLAATLGREFSYELLHAVSLWDARTLQQGLQQLVEAEFLYQRGLPPQATYLFKHALIQDAAYQSLLRSTRQQYHQRIAQVVEERFPERCETQPELLAHHYTEAGLAEQAIGYWQRAGQQASDRSANVEAISHFTTGIELLQTLPETRERTQHAVTLYIALGAALQMTKGQGAPEVEHAYTQARELCQQVGETPEVVPVLFGLWRYYIARPQLHTTCELGETLLRLAQHADDPALTVVAHYALGATWVYLGALPAARQHLEAGIALYTLDQSRVPVFRMGHDPGVGCRLDAARALWLLGYPDQALARLHEALALAHELSHPYSLAFAQCYAAWVSQFRRDVSAVHGHAEAAVALSTEQGFPLWAAWGTSMRGWALAMQGQGEAGLAQVRQGIAVWRATRAALGVPYFCTVLADVADHLGYTDDGLQELAEAHTLVEQQEERWWEAEVSRLRGVVLMRQTGTPQAEAEACFQQLQRLRPPPAGEVAGAAGGDEPQPSVAAAGQARRSL